MKKIIRQKKTISDALKQSALHPVLQQIYANRDIKTLSAIDYRLKNLLHYESLKNIDRAAERIAQAVTAQERVIIVGDYDVDGAVGVALWVRALRDMGLKNVDFIVPNRFTHGYGFTPALFESILPLSPQLIITVDNGISSIEAVNLARAKEIDVIITDHHHVPDALPEAFAIVNPQQNDDLFPSKNLSGVGVAFYVLLAVRAKLNATVDLKQYLDLVALGTVADVVPLDHNNRILVFQGLRQIQQGKACAGILALCHVAGRAPINVTEYDLGYVVGPRLNATGRLDEMTRGIQCLLAEDLNEATQIALELHELNHARRALEKEMQAEAEALIKTENIETLPYGICLFNAKWHIGIIGLLASRIKEKWYRPTIVFAPHETVLKGSARSIPGLIMVEVLAEIQEKAPEVITQFGGHAMAAGLTIPQDQYERFSQLFDEAVRVRLTENDLQEIVNTDGELGDDDLTFSLAEALSKAGPWGANFEAPLFDGVFRVVNLYRVGEKHLKMTLSLEKAQCSAIAFYVDTEYWLKARPSQIHAIYRFTVNEYLGAKTAQIVIDEMESME